MKPTDKAKIKNATTKVISGLKALWERRPRKPKKVKPIKKNTWRRNLKALDLRLDRRQQIRPPVSVEIDDTERTCSNCSTVYHGRVCPQCGQVGIWTRFTWRQAILNFLDIWGLGNRPMFRTLRDLFWRPGYMARDYLLGQRQYYFPPFKLLAIVVVFTLLVSLLPGVEIKPLFDEFDLAKIEDFHPNAFILTLTNAFNWFIQFLSKNLLYQWLFIGVIMVICIRIGFYDVSRYNMIETYIFLVFVLSQTLIIEIPRYLGNSLTNYIGTHAMFFSDGTVNPLVAGFMSVAGLVSVLYTAFVFYLWLLDFRQFYGLKWKSVIKRLILSGSVVIIFALISIYFGALLNNYDDTEKRDILLLAGLMIITIVTAFMFAANYMKKNKALVNTKVIRICKTAMLSVFAGIIVGASMSYENYNLPSSMAAMVLFVILATALSILPIVLYKKYHRTWIATIPLALVIVLVIVVSNFFSE